MLNRRRTFVFVRYFGVGVGIGVFFFLVSCTFCMSGSPCSSCRIACVPLSNLGTHARNMRLGNCGGLPVLAFRSVDCVCLDLQFISSSCRINPWRAKCIYLHSVGGKVAVSAAPVLMGGAKFRSARHASYERSSGRLVRPKKSTSFVFVHVHCLTHTSRCRPLSTPFGAGSLSRWVAPQPTCSIGVQHETLLHTKYEVHPL